MNPEEQQQSEQTPAPSSSSGDTKPAVESITIRIKDQNGQETFFKVKHTTKMRKIFGAFAGKAGIQLDNVRFLLDGQRIDPESTVASNDLEDQDQVDCVLEQTGGFL